MTYIYAGFLSYAHADEGMAERLHKALETYKIPKDHTGTLSPIFRDANELTAHHSLSEKIKGAVEGSKVLIVLCSPAAKASHWVNEEIHLFRKIHGESSILCVLAEGTPDTSFPPSLLEGGREPLAASLGTTKSSFQLGVTQIAAAMLGVGLDTLIQREARRKRRRLQAVTAGALLFSTVMGATTLSAVTARKAAETNRMQAEGLVEYMITDMKEKLEPVGKLDLLDGIGERAVEYYEAQDISKLPDDSLARQARARHILGQVALDVGDYDKARVEIQAAARLTKEVYDRNPNDTDSIFAHAQSEYWVGETYKREENNEENNQAVAIHFENYRDFSEKLYQIDPTNFDWIMEKAWGANNLGYANLNLQNYEQAEALYLEAVSTFEIAAEIEPRNLNLKFELANAIDGLLAVKRQQGLLSEALKYHERIVDIYEQTLLIESNNFKFRYAYAQSLSRVITDGLLASDSDEFNRVLDLSIHEFERFLNYDPKNESWKKEYYFYLEDLERQLDAGKTFIASEKKIRNRLIELRSELLAR